MSVQSSVELGYVIEVGAAYTYRSGEVSTLSSKQGQSRTYLQKKMKNVRVRSRTNVLLVAIFEK